MANFVDEPAGYKEKWQLTAKCLGSLYEPLQRFHALLIATTDANAIKHETSEWLAAGKFQFE